MAAIALVSGLISFVAQLVRITHAFTLNRISAPVLILYVVLGIAMAANFVQIRRRLITRFDYDGATLNFQTLAHPEPQIRSLIELEKISDWRTRAGSAGFVLIFRDGTKLNVDVSLTNSQELVAQLQRDWPEASSTR